ncbi:MAG: Uma2 family endonuclease [Cyanobacteria bacterium SBLK]|nr:Uma2 family endonuclease [Cyanobacteria bacterium SBLK]
MTTATPDKIRWTIADLEIFPENGKRYEIIAGELFVTRAPHWQHQKISLNIGAELRAWCRQTVLGEAATAPGIIFSEEDSVIPDVVWVARERLTDVFDDAGHLIDAPDLAVEVLSKSATDRKRDYEAKLKLYSSQGVKEYWICDRQKRSVQVYRRENGILKLAVTLFEQDSLTSPLLPEFNCLVERFFS